MNDALVPAIIAAGGGSAMLAGVYLHEHRQAEAMRASRIRSALIYPPVDPVQGKAALHALSGLSNVELIFEVVADSDGIRHAMWVPAASQASVIATLTGLLPGLRVSEAPSPQGRATLALKVFIPTPTALVTENPEAASRTLLSGLTMLNRGEEVVIRWALRPTTAPTPPRLRADGSGGQRDPAGMAAKDHDEWRLPSLRAHPRSDGIGGAGSWLERAHRELFAEPSRKRGCSASHLRAWGPQPSLPAEDDQQVKWLAQCL